MSSSTAVTGAAIARRRAVGAEVVHDGVHFRVWAPRRQRVAVVLEAEGKEFPLRKDDHGYFSGLVPDARGGTLYRFRLDANASLFADPASRFQPHGPFGPSMV